MKQVVWRLITFDHNFLTLLLDSLGEDILDETGISIEFVESCQIAHMIRRRNLDYALRCAFSIRSAFAFAPS